MSNLMEVLRNAGCKPQNFGTYITCAATYRGGDDPSSIAIYLNNRIVKDFVMNQTFSLEHFLRKTLNLKHSEQLDKILAGTVEYHTTEFDKQDPFDKESRYYSSDDIVSLVPDHSYWEGRGIPADVVSIFNGGVCTTGKMKDRYVFPIVNSRRKIEGFSGRDVTGEMKMKWKHLGKKAQWTFPLVFSHRFVTQLSQVIIVESIGDMLSLWRSGIKNVAISFGTNIGIGLTKALISLNPYQIIIATNKDEVNRFGHCPGQMAAQKMKTQLTDFFDPNQISIYHPTLNDFGIQTDEQNLTWYKAIPKI